jgi:hypothetical protein
VFGRFEVLKGGLVYEGLYDRNIYRYRLAEQTTTDLHWLNNELGFEDQRPWYFPTAADYQKLFDGGEPLLRLNSLGASYKGTPLQGETAGYLWLSGDFYWKTERHELFAVLYKLVRGGRNPPATQDFLLGYPCFGYSTRGVVMPSCEWKSNVPLAYVFWWRPLDVNQAGRYWCQPGKQASWDPAHC